jgi:molybdopterin molybdotransferase
MLELEDAQQQIVLAIKPLGSEIISLDQAARRVLAEQIVAPISLPPFDNSAMDGYAVRAADVQSAAPPTPVSLKCVGATPAGDTFSGRVERGTCVRVFTGSPLPEGVDAVVMQEDTRVTNRVIEILDAVKPWENVRLAGEDVKAGTLVGAIGERITAGRLALFGALGIERLSVTRRPTIGIIGTGNELVQSGPLRPGQIYESNRIALASVITQSGAIVRVFPLVRDVLNETRSALEAAFAECDAVVTTGGVSVGTHDVVKAAFEALGGSLDFWKVAIKPGKPFAFGRWQEKFLFGLPGNPVSAFVTCLLLVCPALLKLQGTTDVGLRAHSGALAEAITNRGDRRHFVRVRIDSKGMVFSAGMQASHALRSLAAANALLAVPPETEWPAGRNVEVLRWEL